MNVLGIDYGTKRIGIAIGNTEERIAFPRVVLKNDEVIMQVFREFIQKESIECIVLGLPKMLSGKESDMTDEVYTFAKKLEQESTLPIYFEEERFSTKAVRPGTVKKTDIDAASAALILQTYLDRI